MRIIKLFMLVTISAVTTLSQAQVNLEYWSYEKRNVQERKVVEHRHTTEAAVKYHKRIQRVIDLRQKQNKPMVWPKSNIVEILHTAAQKGPNREGGLMAYKSESLIKGDTFNPKDIEGLGSDTFYTTYIKIIDGEEVEFDTAMPIPLEVRNIHKLKIMEDWIFDHKYSDFRVRIVAIAPMYNLSVSGIDLGEQPLFWIKMQDARQLLSNKEVFNPYNDLRSLSFDDWFEQRLFSSYIVEESNVYDTAIKYQEQFEDDGIAQLLEADRIKNDLFIFEHDLWEY